jgi:opacity protein-like surface antigen
MKTFLQKWIACTCVAAVTVTTGLLAQDKPASATWSNGLYLEFGGGTSTVPGGDLVIDGIEWEGEYNAGTLFVASLGKRWNNNWATEFEYFYRSNELDTLTAGNSVLAGGSLDSSNVFLNVIYSFPGIGGSAWRPYAGLGAGWIAQTNIDLDDLAGEQFSASGNFGYQWMIGIQRAFSQNGTAYLEGRAIAGGTQDLDSTSNERTLEVEYNTWSLILGLQWSF